MNSEKSDRLESVEMFVAICTKRKNDYYVAFHQFDYFFQKSFADPRVRFRYFFAMPYSSGHWRKRRKLKEARDMRGFNELHQLCALLRLDNARNTA